MSGIGHNGPPQTPIERALSRLVTDDRTRIEHAIDGAAAVLHGGLLGVEAHFDGEMIVSVEVLRRAIEAFLEDCLAAGGPEGARQYALAIADVLKDYASFKEGT